MTKTDVCNMALDFLGVDPIDDVAGDFSQDAKRLRRMYATAARKILVANEWSDAVKTILLTYESNDDNLRNNEYEYMYDLPSDCLRALDVEFEEELDRLIEGPYIYSNSFGPVVVELTVDSLTSATIVCVEDIDTDVITANQVRVKISDEWMTFSYTSYLNKTFLAVTPDPTDDVTAGDVVNAATDGIPFRYIQDIREEVSGAVVYGEHIALAIARELAVMLAPTHAKTTDETRMLESFAEEALLDAKDADHSSKYSIPEHEEPWT